MGEDNRFPAWEGKKRLRTKPFEVGFYGVETKWNSVFRETKLPPG